MRWNSFLVPANLFVCLAQAIFTDDAFHVDFHRALLGIPQSHSTLFHRPQSSSNASLLYTISDKAVLGAVNPRDGSLVWRQSLTSEPLNPDRQSFLAAGEADGTLTTAHGSCISSWDALSGRLSWSHEMGGDFDVKSLEIIPSVRETLGTTVQDVVVVAGPLAKGSAAVVTRLGGDGSGPQWNFRDDSISHETRLSIATSSRNVYYISTTSGVLSGSKAKVVTIDSTTGKEVTQYTVALESEPLGNAPHLVAGSGGDAPIIISSDKLHRSIKFNLLGTTKVGTITLEDKGEEVQALKLFYAGSLNSASHFLVHVVGKTRQWAEIFHLNAKTGEAKKAYSLPATTEVSTFAVDTVGPAVYFSRVTDNEVSLYSSETLSQLGRWPRSPSSQSVTSSSHAAAEVSTRGASGIAVRLALASNASGWTLIRNSEEVWSRPEMLAYIVKAVWSENPRTISLAQEIAVEASSNPIAAYIHRLTRHIGDLKHLPESLLAMPGAIFHSSDDAGKSTRDRLIGSKMVLATTSRGEIIAIDATNKGAVRWRIELDQATNTGSQVIHLSVADDRLTVLLSDGSILVINVATGRLITTQKSSTDLSQIVELPGSPASAIIKVSADGKPEVLSELAPAYPTEGSVLVTINEQGEALGWTVGSSIDQVWTFRPAEGSKVVQIFARPAHDPIASIGKVLGDRSVLYKYISPNVALLSALSSTTLTMYLLDAVTGTVLHTAAHESILSELPVSAVVSDNWFAYSFTSRDFTDSGLSSQIIVSELYESAVPNDRGLLSFKTNYSSYSADASAKPFVESKAFTVAEPLSDLAVSQTIQGITSRQLITYLSNSRSIVSIQKDILNARRPVDRDPTSDEQEEGLFRYSPILELDPKLFLSHSQEVLGIKQIMTAPTLLESTSLVFAYGHDIFGTQVAPSNAFDVLGKGFKRVQLLMTVVALYLGVLLLRPLVRKKVVERMWQ